MLSPNQVPPEIVQIDHELVYRYRTAVQFNEHHARMGASEILAELMEELERRYDELLNQYGREYRHEYGWASKALE